MPIKRFIARTRSGWDKRRPSRRHAPAALASQVVIRKPMSRRRLLLLAALLALAVGAAGFGLFRAGQLSAGYDAARSIDRIQDLAAGNTLLQEQNAKLQVDYNRAATQLGIERGARQTMEAQIHKLEDEHSQLEQDLALFDNLFPTGKQDNLPAIRSFRVESLAGTPNTWRYRVLVMRGGRAKGDFSGNFQLQVRYRLDGRETLARTPETGNVLQPLQFQRFRRIEGRFHIPPGGVILGAVAQVVENGTLVAESVFHP